MGEEKLGVTHLDPPPSWSPSLALLSLWSLKNQGAHDEGFLEEVQNTRRSGRGPFCGRALPLHFLGLGI